MSFVRPDIIRPPSEHASYYLPLTSGCSNNSCAFCAFSFTTLGIRDLDDVKREIDAMSLYAKSRMWMAGQPDIVYAILRQWDGKRVFLQDGDALVYPYPRLMEALQYLNGKFPALERIASYATPQDVLRRSVQELRDLKKQKLGILYMGVESGDDDVLKKIRKNVSHDQMVEAAKKVKASGILLSVTVILGLGGVAGSEKHALETARILTEMDPDYAGALTLTLIPETEIYKEWESGRFEMITPFDSLR
ncbi:MAG: radical SAM protein, partial [Syntrophaceae bacterium]|nr:radical SAM protein [Syntrophaceae bacterium]